MSNETTTTDPAVAGVQKMVECLKMAETTMRAQHQSILDLMAIARQQEAKGKQQGQSKGRRWRKCGSCSNPVAGGKIRRQVSLIQSGFASHAKAAALTGIWWQIPAFLRDIEAFASTSISG